MKNYDVILKMTPEQMEFFLDNVYLAGMNNGQYAERLISGCEEQIKLLGDNPFDFTWLNADAELATAIITADEEDKYLLDAYVQAALRNAGIHENGKENSK